MANKKVNQLTSKPAVNLTDLFLIADPTSGQAYKTTISDLGTAIGSGVSSVNSLVGAVVLDTDDIQELVSPTNKWFTDTRARAALSASSPLAYNSGTGVFSLPQANGSTNGFLSSADWTTFNAKQAALSGTGFVKISGTTISYDNSTYLTTSGAASTYLALAGGTLTGALNGTSATFTGDLTLSSTNPRLYFTDTDNNPDYFISNTDGTFTIYDVTNSTSRLTIGTTGNGTFGGNLTVGQIIRSGGTSSQFLKADGSIDSNTYLTGSSTSGFVTFWNGSNSVTGFTGFTYNTTTQTLAVQNISLSGNILLPANNTVGGTNYYIGQTMADNDYWRIYGNTVASDQGEMVFHLGDNAQSSTTGGQRFRFYYDNASGGTEKNALIIDYNDSTFYTNLTANSFICSGGTSSQFLKADGSIDSSTYLTTSTAASTYLPLAGGTLTGTLSSNFSGTFSNLYSTGNSGIGTLSTQSITNGISLTIGDATTQHQPYLAFRRNPTGGYWAGINWYDQTTRKSFIEENSNFDLRFGTSNTLALTISSSGAATFSSNVTIGNTAYFAPSLYNYIGTNKFFAGANGTYNYLYAGATGLSIINQADTGTLFTILNGGNVGIGTASPNLYNADFSNLVIANTSSFAGMTIATASTSYGTIAFADGTTGDEKYRGYIQYSHTDDAMIFGSAGSNRMRITSDGDVCIASTAPVSTRRELRIGGNAAGSRISLGLNGTNYSGLVCDSGGNIYLAQEYNDSGIKLLMINYNNGVYLSQSATSWTSNSDERLKTDLVAIENATEKIASLRSVIGRYKTDDESKRRPFLIAQDVYSVLPEAVDIDQKTGMMGVQYTEVIPLLVASIKELKSKIEILENK